MSARLLFLLVGILAALAGTSLWLAARPSAGASAQVTATPAAILAATFRDLEGQPRSLGAFHGKVVVLNFWATWCAPCREEMPGFERLQARWAKRGVQFVGVSAEDAAKVSAFARGLGVRYPLWVGGDEVLELSRRLGNGKGALPHTAILGPGGTVLATRVGAYNESDLEMVLERLTAKIGEKQRT